MQRHPASDTRGRSNVTIWAMPQWSRSKRFSPKLGVGAATVGELGAHVPAQERACNAIVGARVASAVALPALQAMQARAELESWQAKAPALVSGLPRRT